jgi:DNA-binding transcriptional regulator YiaG
MPNQTDRAEVVMTVPREVKGRWVAESRAKGQKLTDWLIRRIESHAATVLPDFDFDGDDPVSPAIFRAAREAAGLTQTEAGALIHCALRTVQDWEAGKRKMHKAFWDLFLRKVAEKKARDFVSA